MPVSSEISVAGPYTPNGETTAFPFAFKAASAGEVIAVDGDGVTISTALYSVTLDDDEGGTLTFGTAPEVADYSAIYIISNPDLTQPSDFDNAGPLACCRFDGHRDKFIQATPASRSKSIGLR